MPNDRIGQYRILGEIAAGSQGVVYRAFDQRGGRVVALKVLHPSLTGDSHYLRRFQREARVAASVTHPNVVSVFDVGEADGRHYIALEFLPESLARLIPREGLPVGRALSLAVGIANGLGAFHARGIVHRDLKPQNVLITPEGSPKVTDFGIARAVGLSTMTATGAQMGTPSYMSPEQAQGERADARSDVYGLGCVLYQMLTGAPPFKAESAVALLKLHVDSDPTPVRKLRPEVPEAVAKVLSRAMAKAPGDRYPSGLELSRALSAAAPEESDGAADYGPVAGLEALTARPAFDADQVDEILADRRRVDNILGHRSGIWRRRLLLAGIVLIAGVATGVMLRSMGMMESMPLVGGSPSVTITADLPGTTLDGLVSSEAAASVLPVSLQLPYAAPGRTVVLDLPPESRAGLGISRVGLAFPDGASGGRLVAVPVSTPGIPPPEGAVVLRYVSLSLSGVPEASLVSATVEFDLPAAWLRANAVESDQVRLFRYLYGTGGWQELETTLLGRTGSDRVFGAFTPGLSLFAVGALP